MTPRAALIASTLLVLPLALATPRGARAQVPAAARRPAASADEGFPIKSEAVRNACGACHAPDDKQRMSRISYIRTTPEGWETIVKRMMALNGLNIEGGQAREVVRYLTDNQGLAPAEAKPAAFEAERRMIEYHYEDKDTEQTCSVCHSMGRVISQRRTKSEWELLVALHRGLYPLVDSQAFVRGGNRQQDDANAGRPADNRQPMEKAVDQLARAFPLTTPDWAAWSATMRPPRLAGRWALSGYQTGKGPVVGEVVITDTGAAGGSEFSTETTITYARTGKRIVRQGRAIVYTGFQWRGRSLDPGAASTATGAPSPTAAASEVPAEWREVMMVDPDWRHASGRWFTGAYDEFGMDVDLQRLGADPLILGVRQPMLSAGGSGQELRLLGAALPASVSPNDLNLGPGVTVDRVTSQAPDQLVLSVSVAADATPGRRTVLLAGARGEATIAVYSKIDFLKVLPASGLARVGGVTVPKQFEQFEARAYANGPDGKPDTADDIELGPVDVTWSIEEYTATYHDDDKNFVGAIDEVTGLFTPNIEGPNPRRRNGTNNFGDVWVVATLTRSPGAGAVAQPLRARAHLLVSPPLYIRWYAPGANQ